MALREAPTHQRIIQDPKILAGKPVIKGTRIPVERVLQHLEENGYDDLFAAYPELTQEDVRASLAYARAVIEQQRLPPAPTPETAG
jgi:uncharacterized protein (DUF433 family)